MTTPKIPVAPEPPTFHDYLMTGSEVAASVVRKIEQVEQPDFRLLTTGCPVLDDGLTLVPGEVTVVAARPGGGKTTLCEYMAARELVELELAVKAGHPDNKSVVYISMEAPDFTLGMHLGRLGALGFVTRDIYRKRVDLKAAKAAALRSTITLERLHVIRHPGIKNGKVADPISSDIITRCIEEIWTQWKRKPVLLVFDFIQRINEDKLNSRAARSIRENIIAGMNAAVLLGESTGAHVLVAAQASREVDNMDPPVPHLGNMLESAAIEQLSHNVIGLGRPITSPATQRQINEHQTARVKVRGAGDGAPLREYYVTKATMLFQVNKCRNDSPGLLAIANLNPPTLELTIPEPAPGGSGGEPEPTSWIQKGASHYDR